MIAAAGLNRFRTYTVVRNTMKDNMVVKEFVKKVNNDVVNNEIMKNKVVNNEVNKKVNNKVNNIVNRGTGAGGSNTNKNGLSYEKQTDLSSEYSILHNNKSYKVINFNIDNKREFILVNKGNLFKYMEMNDKMNTEIPIGHGCKKPDECFICEKTKTIFIIEKKFQQTPGSVCEKIGSIDFKRDNYSDLFTGYNIVYMYCLNDWFKHNCKAEIRYFEKKNFKFFWGDSETYKQDIIKFMLNHS
jgi:hypothetical protein